MSTNLFTFIKSHISILDVVKEYATLKRAGLYWKGHCPFHSEKTASFTVSPHKEIFYCFGCQEGGDVVAFIEKVEQCSATEAVHFLADRYNIDLPEITPQQEEAAQHKKEYFDLCKLFAQWSHSQMKRSASVRQYLEQRNITNESIEHFTIGYFPGGLRSIKMFLHDMGKHQVLPKDLIDAKIINQGKQVLYSPFEERILFPIKDHIGRFCGFGGRVFKPNDSRPKYYNSHENQFFTKGSILFGLDLAKTAIQKSESVFLVEGYTDCVAMVQHGFANTVATLGTACTPEHLAILARYAQKMYVLYDHDNAGKKATLRLVHLCWQASIDPYVIYLPPGQDPASFLNNGGNLNKLISQAKDIFLYFIEMLGADFAQKSLQQKLHITREIIKTIFSVDDQLKRDLLLHKAAQTLKIPFETIKQETKRLSSHSQIKRAQGPASPQINSDQSKEQVSTLEKQIFSAIMNNMLLLNKTNEEYLTSYMPPKLRNILALLAAQKRVNSDVTFVQFFDCLSESEKQLVSKCVTTEDNAVSGQDFCSLLTQLHKKHWKALVNDIKLKLENADNKASEEEIKQIMNDFLTLRKKMLPKQGITEV